jgi:hypothetical protein
MFIFMSSQSPHVTKMDGGCRRLHVDGGRLVDTVISEPVFLPRFGVICVQCTAASEYSIQHADSVRCYKSKHASDILCGVMGSTLKT